MAKHQLLESPNSLITHANNFDFLRLFFALSVMVTHSYALNGLPEADLLVQFSHGQASLSHTGVQGFLIISGFLIAKSLVRSQSILDYYYKRALRVFPGLWVLVGITVVVCFFFSDKSLFGYLKHYTTRDYICYNALLKTQYKLDGVFSVNPYPNAVNGSLWTIPYEFFFYIVLSSCFFIRTHTRVLRWGFVGLFGVLVYLFLTASPALQAFQIPFWFLGGQHLVELGAFFVSGAIWSFIPLPTVKIRRLLAVVAAGGWVASLYFGGYNGVQFLALPVLVISFGSLSTPLLSWVRTYGDFSYGIYLWGFFVQQMLMALFHLPVLELMGASIIITYGCGALSWHLVEKQALRLKLRLQPSVAPALVAYDPTNQPYPTTDEPAVAPAIRP